MISQSKCVYIHQADDIFKLPKNQVITSEASGGLIDSLIVNWKCTWRCILRPTFKASLWEMFSKNQHYLNAWRYTVNQFK